MVVKVIKLPKKIELRFLDMKKIKPRAMNELPVHAKENGNEV